MPLAARPSFGTRIENVLSIAVLAAMSLLPLIEIAKNRKLASELVDKVGMNDGPTE